MFEPYDDEFFLWPNEQLNAMTTPQLLEYKKSLQEHGERVEDYIEELKDSWKCVLATLKSRMLDLEFEMATIQADKDDEEDLLGSGNPIDTYLN